MDPQSPLSSLPPQRSTLQNIFLNERGLRAGWRFGIFVLLLMAFFFVIITVVRLLHHLRGPSAAAPVGVAPIGQLTAEIVPFRGVRYAIWGMSLYEHLKVG